jgi:hypothetical protein
VAPVVNWTEEKIAELYALLKTGISYSKIAARLSAAWKVRVTKNMIVGAASRNGYIRKRIRKVAIRKPVIAKPIKKKVRFVVGNIRGTCQYIEGEPAGRNFCGAPVVRDTGIPHAAPVWCAKHLRMVYIPRNLFRKKTATRQGKFVIWETSHIKTDESQ